MPPLTYIANPYSMHLPIWLQAARACGLTVRIETAEPEGAGNPADVPTQYLTPRWVKGPAILRYLWAGVVARFRRRQTDEILHAHCSSGNGMIAWMSGRSYIVTIYGGEVLEADERGRVYKWFLHRVLKGAGRITATSPQMVELLTSEYGIARERIHFFDLGLETQTFRPATDEQRRRLRADRGISADEPVWIAVKRAVPPNRTLEMVQAFLQHRHSASSGRLIVLCGKAEADYVRRIRQVMADSGCGDRVILVEDWLESPAVARWLQMADFALSVAMRDQMSNAVLEAMACGAMLILSDIGGYRSLKERGAPVRWIDNCTTDSLQATFEETAALPEPRRDEVQQAGVEFIHQHYAHRNVWEVLQPLYDLPPRKSDESRRAA